MNPNPFCFHLFFFVKFRLYNTKVEKIKPNPLILDPVCKNGELLLIPTVGFLSSTADLSRQSSTSSHLPNPTTLRKIDIAPEKWKVGR